MIRTTKIHSRKPLKLLVSDNDATLLSLHHWFAPAMLAAIPLVAAALNAPIEEVGAELGRNMLLHRALETAFPFASKYFADKWKGSHEDFVEQVSKPYFALFDSCQQRYSTPFPGVLNVLEAAEAHGVKVVILSDAPLHSTLVKLSVLGLQERVSGVYSLTTYIPQGEEVWNQADFEYCQKRLADHLALKTQFKHARVVALPNEFEKPHPQGLKWVLEDFEVRPNQALMVGDSYLKDGGVAKAVGVRFAHARYGVDDFAPPQYMEVIKNLLIAAKESELFWAAYGLPDVLPPVVAELATYKGLVPFILANRRKSVSAKKKAA